MSAFLRIKRKADAHLIDTARVMRFSSKFRGKPHMREVAAGGSRLRGRSGDKEEWILKEDAVMGP